jgi:hypothetical protein
MAQLAPQTPEICAFLGGTGTDSGTPSNGSRITRSVRRRCRPTSGNNNDLDAGGPAE